jgi:hypothetical protein
MVMGSSEAEVEVEIIIRDRVHRSTPKVGRVEK